MAHANQGTPISGGRVGGLGLQNNSLPRTEQRAQRRSQRARLFVPVCLSQSIYRSSLPRSQTKQ